MLLNHNQKNEPSIGALLTKFPQSVFCSAFLRKNPKLFVDLSGRLRMEGCGMHRKRLNMDGMKIIRKKRESST
jgi:hypothetical protein